MTPEPNVNVPGYAGWDCPMEASSASGPTKQKIHKAIMKRITRTMTKRVVAHPKMQRLKKKWN